MRHTHFSPVLGRIPAQCAFWFGLAIAIFVACIAPPSAHAQQPAPDSRERKHDFLISVEWGFGDLVMPERWSRVLVTVTASPSSVAQNGILAIEYRQDATQRSVISELIAVTPGRSTTIELPICLPAEPHAVQVSFTPQRGRSASLEFSSMNFGRDDTNMLPQFANPDGVAILTCGLSSPVHVAALDQWAPMLQRTSGHELGTVHRIEPGRLSALPTAYDSLACLVVDSEVARTLEPRVLAAIRQWVVLGGRLVIDAHTAGDAWRLWLPPGSPGEVMRLDEPEQWDVPADIARAVIARTDAAQKCLELAAAIKQAKPVNPDPQVEVEEQAQRIPGLPQAPLSESAAAKAAREAAIDRKLTGFVRWQRAAGLTPAGTAAGWKLRWTQWGQPELREGRGLVAEGPMGLGYVTVLGISPALLAVEKSDASTVAAWENAFQSVLSDRVAPAATGQYYRTYSSRSGDTSRSQQSIGALLDAVSTTPPITSWVFVFIAAAVALLALLIGPIDFIMLKRISRATGGLRHRSHISALLWIGLASAVSYSVPRSVRTSETLVNRVSMIDAVVGDPAAPGIAAASSITGVWSGLSEETAFIEAAPSAEPDSARGWWRGISPVTFYTYSDNEIAIPSVQYAPRPVQITSDDPVWGGFSRSGDASIAPALNGGLDLRNWTFRGFLDDVRSPLPFRVELVKRDGDWCVNLAGLPESASVNAAALRLGDQWRTLAFTREGAILVGKSVAESDSDAIRKRFEPTFQARATPEIYYPRYYDDESRRDKSLMTEGAALNLPQPFVRGLSHAARAASGRWGVVYLSLTGMNPDVKLQTPVNARNARAIVARISVPLPAEPPADASR